MKIICRIQKKVFNLWRILLNVQFHNNFTTMKNEEINAALNMLHSVLNVFGHTALTVHVDAVQRTFNEGFCSAEEVIQRVNNDVVLAMFNLATSCREMNLLDHQETVRNYKQFMKRLSVLL